MSRVQYRNNISAQQLAFVLTILNNSSFGDCGDYKIGASFQGVGHTYLQGQRGWLHPRHVVTLKEGFEKAHRNLEVLQKNSVEEQKRSLLITANYFPNHPTFRAYFLGLKKGINAEFRGATTTWEGVYGSREIPQEEIELAIASGAVFGNKTKLELDEIDSQLRTAIRYGKPRSFYNQALALFAKGYRTNPEQPFLDDIVDNPRFELFERKLFESVIEDMHQDHQDAYFEKVRAKQ